MAVQNTARKSSELATITGTRVRNVVPTDLFYIMRQVNVVGALIGGPHVGNDGKTIVKGPKIIKTRKIDNPLTEWFTNRELTQSFVVTTGGDAAATTIVVTDTNGEVYDESWMAVAETGDVLYVSNVAAGSLTVERQAGAAAIDEGMHLVSMGQLAGELSSNPSFLIRDDDNNFNYASEFHKAWRVSQREQNTKRYVGNSFKNLQKQKLIEIMRDMENRVILSRRIAAAGATPAATTPRGLESWAVDGDGSVVDFGGTVELSELRELGNVTSEWSSNRKICLTSQRVISTFMSALDTKLRMSPSELKEKAGLAQAKAFDLGADTIEFVPCNTYGVDGKEGQGVIFDPMRLELRYLQDLTLYKVGPEDDSTLTTDVRGDWYMDHGALACLDGGEAITYFQGANSLAS